MPLRGEEKCAIKHNLIAHFSLYNLFSSKSNVARRTTHFLRAGYPEPH